MSDTATPTVDASAGAADGPRRVWPPVVLALACASAYALFFVVPYYVNDLGRFPLDDVAAGYHDPRDLWPMDTAYARFFALGGLLMVRIGVIGVLVALVWSVTRLVRDHARLDRLRRAALLLAVVVAFGTLVWRASTFGQALTAWWLD